MAEPKVTILGCGSSAGVPLYHPENPNGYWGKCDPTNPKNRRTRSSIFVEINGVNILVDTSPDLKSQCLAQEIGRIDAVLYTHAHSDHCHGIDDLRNFYHARNLESFPVYARKVHMDEIMQRFNYLFIDPQRPRDMKTECLIPNVIDVGKFSIGDAEILGFEQIHGLGMTMGYRFGNVAYSTDFNDLDEKALQALEGLDLWILDCLRFQSSPPSHNNFTQALRWIEKVKPKQAVLTHMGESLDEAHLRSILPPHIQPAYDGMGFGY